VTSQQRQDKVHGHSERFFAARCSCEQVATTDGGHNCGSQSVDVSLRVNLALPLEA